MICSRHIARPQALGTGAPRHRLDGRITSIDDWSPPQAALKIACLTKDCTNTPNSPVKILNYIIGIARANRLALKRRVGIRTTYTTTEQAEATAARVHNWVGSADMRH